MTKREEIHHMDGDPHNNDLSNLVIRRRGQPPKALDSIVDVVLAYRPKAKSKPARRRKRRATKIAKGKK